MRIKKRLVLPTPSVVFKVASQTVMGIAMGLALTLILTVVDQQGVVRLIDHDAGQDAVFVFVGTIVTTFGHGCDIDRPDFDHDRKTLVGRTQRPCLSLVRIYDS
jgi:hypothetical protein